jgi:hypothetical protein
MRFLITVFTESMTSGDWSAHISCDNKMNEFKMILENRMFMITIVSLSKELESGELDSA